MSMFVIGHVPQMMPLICKQAHEEPFSRKPPTFEETQPKKKKIMLVVFLHVTC